MVNGRDVYRSAGDYLKSADIPKGPGWLMTVATSEAREFEQTRDDGSKYMASKVILGFAEIDAKLVCAKTVFDEIAMYYGEETDEWHGRKIIVFVAENVKNPRGSGPALRVRIPPEDQLRTAAPAAPPAPPRDHMQAHQQQRSQPQPARPSHIVPNHYPGTSAPVPPGSVPTLPPARLGNTDLDDDSIPF